MVNKKLQWYLDKFEERHENLFFIFLMLFLYIISIIISIIVLLTLAYFNINISPSQPFADNVFCMSILLFVCYFVYCIIQGISDL